jgi:hypothetical protein
MLYNAVSMLYNAISMLYQPCYINPARDYKIKRSGGSAINWIQKTAVAYIRCGGMDNLEVKNDWQWREQVVRGTPFQAHRVTHNSNSRSDAFSPTELPMFITSRSISRRTTESLGVCESTFSRKPGENERSSHAGVKSVQIHPGEPKWKNHAATKSRSPTSHSHKISLFTISRRTQIHASQNLAATISLKIHNHAVTNSRVQFHTALKSRHSIFLNR